MFVNCRPNQPMYKPSCDGWQDVASSLSDHRAGKKITPRACYDRTKFLVEAFSKASRKQAEK